MGSPALEPQRVLAGRYRLEERLGAGGMGAIWRAEHLTLQAPVAVKLIDREALPDEDTIARFLREAKAAATLRSPHVVQILDYGMDLGVPFMVMELLEGENLAQRLKRVGRLTPNETVRTITHVGRAVARAHEAGIVHRDLKPENVFLVQNEDEEIAKVLDFGVAKIEHGALREATRTRTGSILGTPYYMSPEQAQGNKAVDYRSDLWSLAVIAFESLTGQRPFYSDGLGDLVIQICVRDLPVPSDFASVPPGFDAWFARGVSRDPDLRFQSARELTEALREALGIDAREGRSTMPELLVSSSPNEPRREASNTDPNAETLALEPAEVQRLARSGVGEHEEGDVVDARSSSVPPSSRAVGAASRSLGRRTAPLEPLPRHSSGLGTVVAVAAAALALGLAGGLVALRQLRVAQETPAAEPVPVVPTALQPPGQRTAAPPPVHEAPASDPDPAAVSTAPGSASAALPPAAADSAPVRAPPVSGVDKRARTEQLDAGVPRATSPDGGWVKPDWAIPDEEPVVVPEPDPGYP